MKRYTAQEMRVRADYEESANANTKTAAMLRQAADVLEREEKREKKYEYAAMFMRKRTGKCVGKSASHYDSIEEAKRNHKWPLVGEDVVFVRREAGKWEEVPND